MNEVSYISNKVSDGPNGAAPAALPDLPRIVLLVKDRPAAWALMPEAIERVKRFCLKIDSEYKPETLERIIQTHFTSETPKVVLLVAVSAAGDVVGHILASIEEWGDHKYLVVIQYDKDEHLGMPIDFLRAGLEAIEEFGRMHGAEKTRAFALTEEWERGLRMFYGFKKIRTMMERSL